MKRMLGLSKRRRGKGSSDEPKGVDLVQGGLLQNFMVLVDAAIMLQPTSLVRLAKSDLDRYIALMIKENLVWPTEVQTSLLSRKASELTSAGAFSDLISIMNPWLEPKAFDPFQPQLSDLSMPQDQKVLQFGDAVFRKLFPEIVTKGESMKQSMLSISQGTLKIIDTVDQVTLDTDSSMELAAMQDIANTMVALTTDTTDVDYEAPSGGVCVGGEVWV